MECSRFAKWSSGMLWPLAGYGSSTACSCFDLLGLVRGSSAIVILPRFEEGGETQETRHNIKMEPGILINLYFQALLALCKYIPTDLSQQT